MPIMPGAEPFHHEGGPVGVLLCHGFTGSPQSLRPWGDHLAANGFSVACPRLPGHGTRWQDMNDTRWPDWYAEVDRALSALRARCDEVFLGGLSMGGTLAIRLAEQHGAAVSGLILVNPSLGTDRWDVKLLPVLKRVLGSRPGVANDIKKAGSREVAYDRLPLKAAHSLQEFWATTRADLADVDQPILLFRSREDHVVEPLSGRLLIEGVHSSDVEERLLEDSYHVATLDNDAPAIFEASVAWIHAHSRRTVD
ncbi:MAG: alpha/beta fold hydrolase [Geodermatophilaceae bacterium]|nr:alpha/beta fold hydrolase [Geodermatophilaceae bacterium]